MAWLFYFVIYLSSHDSFAGPFSQAWMAWLLEKPVVVFLNSE